MSTYRCVGTLYGGAGDCLRPVVGALLCYGYLDRAHPEYARPLEESIEGPRPLLFPVCKLHRAPLEQWAEHLWGKVAPGMFVPLKGIAYTVRWMEAERDPVVLSPDPHSAVAIA